MKKRHIDGQDRRENPEVNPGTNGQLIYDREARMYNEEKTVSVISGAGETGQLHVKE